ncbi:MAG: hypothetical protein GEU80_13640 [Dehalococcoidia bacterium]|nr:hypothetical protein [Dehalococcoidia bacterium]
MVHRIYGGLASVIAAGVVGTAIAALEASTATDWDATPYLVVGTAFVLLLLGAGFGWYATRPHDEAGRRPPGYATSTETQSGGVGTMHGGTYNHTIRDNRVHAGQDAAISKRQAGGVTAAQVGSVDQSTRYEAQPDPFARFDALIDAVHDYEKAVQVELDATRRFAIVDDAGLFNTSEHGQRREELNLASQRETEAREALKRQASRNGSVTELRQRVDEYSARCSSAVPWAGEGARARTRAWRTIDEETNRLIDWLNENARPV